MDQVQIRGKTVFLIEKDGKIVPHAWGVHNPYMNPRDGKFQEAGPIKVERNLSTGRATILHDENGAHEIQYNSQHQIIGVGDEEVQRPGSLDWLNE